MDECRNRRADHPPLGGRDQARDRMQALRPLFHPLRVAAAGAMAMLRVRRRGMMVVMIVIVVVVMLMVMIVTVRVIMMMTVMNMAGVRADALDVVMMPGLGQADLGLEADYLLTILAELAVHVRR